VDPYFLEWVKGMTNDIEETAPSFATYTLNRIWLYMIG
jgi:hypothetical protein